jgi:hypothetical protein
VTQLDLAIRGGTIVTASDEFRADIGIRDGHIVSIADHIDGAAREIDATGLLALPGGIDSHVHISQPSGRSQCSRAAASSSTTTSASRTPVAASSSHAAAARRLSPPAGSWRTWIRNGILGQTCCDGGSCAMKIVVFGGTGFVGLNLAEVLLARGHDVMLYDRADLPAAARVLALP